MGGQCSSTREQINTHKKETKTGGRKGKGEKKDSLLCASK